MATYAPRAANLSVRTPQKCRCPRRLRRSVLLPRHLCIVARGPLRQRQRGSERRRLVLPGRPGRRRRGVVAGWPGGGGQAGRSGDREPAVGVQPVPPAGRLVLAAVVAGAVAGEVGGRGRPVGPAAVVVEFPAAGHTAPAAGEAAAAVAGPDVPVELGGRPVAV